MILSELIGNYKKTYGNDTFVTKLNAKELCLAKLNANAKMAGMYIYGLTMGIPFVDLGRLLMSDIGNTISDLLKGSIITDELQLNTVDSVIDFIKNPILNIRKLYNGKRLWDQKTGLKGNKSVWVTLDKNIASGKGWNNYDLLEGIIKDMKADYGEKGYLYTFIENAEKNEKSASEIVISLQSIKRALESRLSNGNIPLNKYLQLQALDALINAYNAKAKIESSESYLWKGAFNDFITLHYGASELKTLGSFLGANLGVKNTYADFLNFVKNFENTLKDAYNMYKKYKGETIENFDTSLNLSEFIHDPEYRLLKIKAYEQVKASFNILEVLTTVPHYWGYLQTVYAKHGALYESSARHRTTHKYINELSGALNMEKRIKALDRLVESKTIKNLFNISDKYFYISKGTDIITLDSTDKSIKTPADKVTKIYLGNYGGDATYKNWVEKEVIPNLKQGFISNRHGIKNTAIANNGFIKSLHPNTFTLNLHKNSSISHTTNIDMSPRTDEDKIALDNLILEFDALTTSYTIFDEDGNKYSIPIKEIFYLYNLVAYSGKSGQGTLTRIFDNYAIVGGKEFRQITKDFDDSGSYYNLSDLEIIVGTSQIENPYGSYSKYIYYKNKKDLVVDLLVKDLGSYEEIEGANESRIGSYVINGSIKDIDTNLILSRPTDIDRLKINTKVLNIDWEIIYDPVTKSFIKLLSNNGMLLLNIDKVQELLVQYDPNTGNYLLDIENLTNLIEYQINCL